MRSVSIIGAGIGAAHLAGYLALPDRFRVSCICDVNEARARELAAPHGLPVLTDMAQVLDDDSVDIVDICLPPHLHLEACIAALEAGKHVVCEKPLVTSLAQADKLIAKAAVSLGRVFPVFQYRYGPGMTQIRALIDAGLAGKCYAATLETHWDRDASYYAIDWRGTWAGERGGALLGHAIHIHDMLSSILGPIARVYADVATRVNEIEVEDCAALSIRMADGTLATSSVTLGAAGNTSRLRLMFDGFTVESDHAPYAPAGKGWSFTARPPVSQDDLDKVLAQLPDAPSGFPGLFAAMDEAMVGASGNEVTLADGRNSLEFVTACYASARSGAPVELPIGSEHPLYEGWLP